MANNYQEILDTPLGPTQSVMAVMDHTGDSKITWDRDVKSEVDMARETWDRWKKKNYMPYRVKRDGTKGEIIREFDPAAEVIIFAPPFVGGREAKVAGLSSPCRLVY